ncbi:MAG: dTDP-glucose 4,6-dehydratase [Coriobacteriia bacterium]|nr:dTDP-glucose 4,6-dehydratase [Coriobacteriia bacterium]
MKLLVTGGAGFIGTNFVRQTLSEHPQDEILVLDKLGYAGKAENLAGLERCRLVVGDILDKDLVFDLAKDVDAIVHFAAESHNDNSLLNPDLFVQTNVVGTVHILEACREYKVRLHHISTDEVFGDLALDDPQKFTRLSPYKPSSPYSASKAAADMMVRAWVRSFGVFASISNCSNNYGPYQHVEKFIPRMITNRFLGVRPRVYGTGQNVRDWIHVDDHNHAVYKILETGKPGETYLLGANGELSNLEVVRMLNKLMGYEEDDYELVSDRAGHDRRYAIDARESYRELDWTPEYTNFELGLSSVITWYKNHPEFWEADKAQVEAQYKMQGK